MTVQEFMCLTCFEDVVLTIYPELLNKTITNSYPETFDRYRYDKVILATTTYDSGAVRMNIVIERR